MATTLSNRSRGVRSAGKGRRPGVRGEKGSASEATSGGKGAAPSAGARQSSDQYSTQALHSILREMRAQVTRATSSSLTTQSEAVLSSELSEFERVFMDFFGGTRSFQAMLKDAEQHYNDRALEEWKNFYDTFYAYAQEKQTKRSTIRKLIYRGIVEADARPSKHHDMAVAPMLVADLVLERSPRNRVEKFVRFPIPNASIKAHLQALTSGDVITDELLDALLSGDEVPYLNLCYRPVRKGLRRARDGALAQNLERQAAAAERATEAMQNRSMGISSQAASLAAEQMKKK